MKQTLALVSFLARPKSVFLCSEKRSRLQLEYQVYLWGRGGRRREKRKEETANFSLP